MLIVSCVISQLINYVMCSKRGRRDLQGERSSSYATEKWIGQRRNDLPPVLDQKRIADSFTLGIPLFVFPSWDEEKTIETLEWSITIGKVRCDEFIGWKTREGMVRNGSITDCPNSDIHVFVNQSAVDRSEYTFVDWNAANLQVSYLKGWSLHALYGWSDRWKVWHPCGQLSSLRYS